MVKITVMFMKSFVVMVPWNPVNAQHCHAFSLSLNLKSGLVKSVIEPTQLSKL